MFSVTASNSLVRAVAAVGPSAPAAKQVATRPVASVGAAQLSFARNSCAHKGFASSRATFSTRAARFVFSTVDEEVDSDSATEPAVEEEAAVEADAPVEEEAAEEPKAAALHKLYVGNVPYVVDNATLADAFSDYGKVLDAVIITDRETGRSKGFGFVTYEDNEQAQKAIETLNGAEWGGRILRVNEAREGGSGPSGERRSNRRFSYKYQMWVGNLPFTMAEEELRELFSDCGEVLDARVITEYDTGRSRGFGFVSMSTEDEMSTAIEKYNGYDIAGRALKVNPSQESGRR